MFLSDIKTAIRHWFCFFFHAIVWKAKRCKIQETKLASRWTNLLSRSRQISIKLSKINSRSTDFLSMSRHLESSSTKWHCHFQEITFQRQEIFESSSREHFRYFQRKICQFHASFHTNPKFPITFQQRDHSRSSRECCQQPKYFVNNHAKHCQHSSKQILRVLFMKYLPIFTLWLRSLYWTQ